MTALPVALPIEIPGEDVANPPFPPVPAVASHPEPSSEYFGALRHEGWPAARPAWEDLTAEDIDEHRSWCQFTCADCEAHRQFGYCPGCTSSNAEAIDGITICCSQTVMFGDGVERAWVA